MEQDTTGQLENSIRAGQAASAIADRGSHVEVEIGLPELRGGDLIDLLVRATDRFGAKPMLVICDDLGGK